MTNLCVYKGIVAVDGEPLLRTANNYEAMKLMYRLGYRYLGQPSNAPDLHLYHKPRPEPSPLCPSTTHPLTTPPSSV